ncbi:MAG: LLM class F420-dependent oxidoreductase [Anaerolineae bacterium]|nr:LLM class F420-dependent oxidoreductase [Anaerolineae bacterium]
MRIGLHVGNFQWPGSPANLSEKLVEIAQMADAAGFYSLTVMDHLFQLGEQYGEIHGPWTDPMLEGYSTIAYLAAKTQYLKLGLLVTCGFLRPPGLLIKTVSTLDVLSGGRAMLGIGAGWFEEEVLGLGIPLPETWRERFERLEETLQIAHHMWKGNTEPFRGKYYQLANPINMPRPVSRPHPLIIIGGSGEKKTLRLVAQYADAGNLVVGSPCADESFGVMARKEESYAEWLDHIRQYTRRKLNVLQQHCEACGRSYGEIEKSVVTYIKVGADGMSSGEVLQLCHDFAELGFQYVIFVILNCHDIEPLAMLGRSVIPAVG